MKEMILLLLGASLINNVVLSQFLGLCPFLGVSRKTGTAAGMGAAVLFVITVSSFITGLLYEFVLEPLGLVYLQTIVFILVIAALVQLVEMILRKKIPSLYKSLGVYLPLITVNCIILGRAEMFASKNSVGKSALDGIGMGVGFTLALVAMATVREVFGAASFAGIAIPFLEAYKIEVLVKAPGGMVVYGLLIALIGALTNGKAPKKKEFSCAGCPSAGHCGNACTANGKENA